MCRESLHTTYITSSMRKDCFSDIAFQTSTSSQHTSLHFKHHFLKNAFLGYKKNMKRDRTGDVTHVWRWYKETSLTKWPFLANWRWLMCIKPHKTPVNNDRFSMLNWCRISSINRIPDKKKTIVQNVAPVWPTSFSFRRHLNGVFGRCTHTRLAIKSHLTKFC